MAYNGWSNYETWNVALWFGNDEGLYHAMNRFLRSNPRFDAGDVEEFVREMLPKGTPDFDSPKDYQKVDWDEIANSWREEEGEETDETED